MEERNQIIMGIILWLTTFCFWISSCIDVFSLNIPTILKIIFCLGLMVFYRIIKNLIILAFCFLGVLFSDNGVERGGVKGVIE